MREDLENLALACRRDYFKRSSSPVTLIALHDLIHYSLPFVYLVPFCQFIHQLKESFIGAPTSSSAFAFILEYVFLAFFCLLILSSGSFIISLTIYTLPFHLSLTLPLFHPFLHLHFVTMVGILLSSRQSSSLEGPTGSIIPMTQQSDDNVEILTAWRAVTSHPFFKEADVNDLCAEFTAQAKCDGTNIVLDPQGVDHILKTIS
ncbi:hypothetical protein JOM56_013062, partial [Amanita muscaria]